MSRAWWVTGVCGLLALGGGCGSPRPPPASDNAAGTPGGAGAGTGFDSDAGSTKPPGCGVKPDGTSCDCIDVALFTDPPNMYFVLDRSGSMAEDNKWTQVRVVVGKILRSLGPRANFGATIYPSNGDVCGPGTEIMPIRPGDPPSSSTDGPTTEKLLTASQVPPFGGTPTSATLQAVLGRLRSAPGRTFVILATDGAPNCNAERTCGVDGCMPNIENAPECPRTGPKNCCEPPEGFRENCVDDAASAQAAAALFASGIPVYVIGLPGSALYSRILDDIATAGGTAAPASPKYFAVDAASEAAMLAALKKVAAKIVATCTFELREEHDEKLVNVYLDDVVLPHDPVNGWDIHGRTVTLVGSTCDRVKNGDVLDVRIIAGCPRIEPR